MRIEKGQGVAVGEAQGSVRHDRARQEDPLMRVAKKFEAIFVNEMVSSMRKTVGKDGFLPQSSAEKMFQSMVDYENSQKISESGQLGLSRMIYDHLLRTQIRR